jgi:hypothetical protein
MWAHLLDRSMYYVGRKVAHKDGIRKWRDRPAIAPMTEGEIMRVEFVETPYGPSARCLVRFDPGNRWVQGCDLELFGESLEISTPKSRNAKGERILSPQEWSGSNGFGAK